MRSERLTNLSRSRWGNSPDGPPISLVGQRQSLVHWPSAAHYVGCEQVTDQLPGILDGAEEAHPAVVSHVEHCLRCQAELAQYRRLLRALHQLRVVGVEPPDCLLSEVLAQFGEAAERGAIRSALTGRRVSYVAALAAAAGAAGVAGAAVLLASRGRASKGGAHSGAYPARLSAKMPLAS